jgi:hypothetical protein
VALDIPEVPAIPELSPEEKGDVGTVHHVRQPAGSHDEAAQADSPGDDDTEAAQNGQGPA